MVSVADNLMSFKIPCTSESFSHGMDAVIDVRSPSEYQEDHIPGAINLSVMTNEERSLIGKQYTFNSFEARRNGAAIISRNISDIIEKHFMNKPKSYSCLIYCWRGGQRSRSLALVLSMIGYSVKHLTGGYKTYRKQVISSLSTLPAQFTYKVVGGMTGSGKTLLLKQLHEAGEQVLDFEALANHKGSVLGVNNNNRVQPSTKLFETRITEKLRSFTKSKPVWVESEGKRIGSVQIPNTIFEMVQSKITDVYVIQAERSSRTSYLLSQYDHFTENPSDLKECLQTLSKFNVPLKRWFNLIDGGKFEAFVLDILENYYDPLYKKSLSSNFMTARFNDICKSHIIEVGEVCEKTMHWNVLPRVVKVE